MPSTPAARPPSAPCRRPLRRGAWARRRTSGWWMRPSLPVSWSRVPRARRTLWCMRSPPQAGAEPRRPSPAAPPAPRACPPSRWTSGAWLRRLGQFCSFPPGRLRSPPGRPHLQLCRWWPRRRRRRPAAVAVAGPGVAAAPWIWREAKLLLLRLLCQRTPPKRRLQLPLPPLVVVVPLWGRRQQQQQRQAAEGQLRRLRGLRGALPALAPGQWRVGPGPRHEPRLGRHPWQRLWFAGRSYHS
mmetsp:Transcript_17713/g.62067  ORF Transcript_17713/g.62067 Transcript_17713/m.62067 type:complete len:242 (+) Transcript_17713:2136-2861(+)